MSRDDEPTQDEDDEVTRQLRADAAHSGGVPGDLWDRIDADLSRGGLRERVTSRPTSVRIGLGLLGVLLFAGLLVALQGIRGDLDHDGWFRFARSATPLVVAGLAASAFSLVHRGHVRPVPGLAIVAIWATMVASSTLGDWPGLPSVPASMDLWCFGVTSVSTVATMLWLTWLDRGVRPVVWRVGTAGAGAGLAAYVAQGVFCPGVDPVHLLVAHGGASVVWALVAMLGAWALALRR